jgi:hypothetical protein
MLRRLLLLAFVLGLASAAKGLRSGPYDLGSPRSDRR